MNKRLHLDFHDKPNLEVILHPRFIEWINSISDRTVRNRLLFRIDKVKRGLIGDYKYLSCGLYELREFFGSGWRIYFVLIGNLSLLILHGGRKKSQKKDIEYSFKLLEMEGLHNE